MAEEPAAKRVRGGKPPATTFPYKLDGFQQESVDALEEGNSVMVAAHTSAGKTTVAIYAIAMALREKQRVIYTSPIKALSNQKYRELGEKFESVGLMTGDVTIRPEADCLVMTTEILRSMIYRGSEMLREVGCVIFDEVHYMRDKIRGVAWEETIILLPDKVQFVFLSATIPNSEEFGKWIEHIHPGKKCKCIYTDYRPTPLQHYIFPSGADGIYLVVDEKGDFKDETFQRAMTQVGGSGGGKGGGKGGKGKGKGKGKGDQSGALSKVVKLIMAKKLSPLIVFSFSKKECEQYAMNMARLDFTTDEEKELIEQVFTNAMDSLGEEDRQLPAVQQVLPILKRGIGFHHAGLLPILKETVELLFQEQLLKVLFSTETFAMGLNMPARTVIFTSVRKFDGQQQRWLTCGEYVQMSGRAGRRGLDKNGLAIAMIDEAVPPETIKEMTSGKADVLKSAFHLTYNMVLNVLRVEDIDPLYIMQRSFLQFQVDRNRPMLEEKSQDLAQKVAKLVVNDEDTVSAYFKTCAELKKYQEQIRAEITKPSNALRFLQTGRLLHIISGDNEYGWGVLAARREETKVDEKGVQFSDHVLDVFVDCMDDASQREADERAGAPSQRPRPCPPGKPGETPPGQLRVVSFRLSELTALSSSRVQINQDMQSPDALRSLRRTLRGLVDKGLTRLDPVTQMNIDSNELRKAMQRVEQLTARKARSKCHNTSDADLLQNMSRFESKQLLQGKIEEIRSELRESKKTVLQPELKSMLRVLRRLGYTDADNIVKLKGRVAVEICASGEMELLLCEMLFANIFKGLDVAQSAALLSCLVNQEKTPDNFEPLEEYKQPLSVTYEINNKINELEKESGLTRPEDEQERVKPAMLKLTDMWMKGAKFAEITKDSEMYEGTIIRMMRQLEETLRQIAAATRVIGDEDLYTRFMQAIQLMRRDIVFANSLYI
eukprot:Hpha_TRINITY_DN15283_c0_g2::TRINITY_DN15283_c0_g2_i1::g.68153::m.68153/K12598/MTR4, SKIV2L2; ATP-dependent RNA helicase DOB1